MEKAFILFRRVVWDLVDMSFKPEIMVIRLCRFGNRNYASGHHRSNN